jgi:hypothetical protein
MADPRSNLFSVKPCPPENLGKSFANISDATSQRKNFFNSIGKVGDLEVLNDVGASKIGQGLRTLASISNSIRQGCGSLPTSLGSAIGGGLDAGTGWVLDNVGIARTTVDAVRQFSPQIANQGYGQARQIFERVKQGDFKTSDIPSYLQDFQNLERLGRNIFTPSASDNKSLTERCEASPYAIDLIQRAPKYKFLFVVQFICNEQYQDLNELDFAFVVKRSTRPTTTFVMEDVNYYNFRTKHITKVEFSDMDMAFHDDNNNLATRFYSAYTKAMSPISNVVGLYDPEEYGMDFTSSVLSPNNNQRPIENNIPSSYYTASRGPLAGYIKNIIQEIRLFHVFDYGQKMNVFRFFNPRITSFDLDEVDMSIGDEGSQINMKFNYDSVYVDTDIPMDDSTYAIADRSRNAVYPLKYNDGNSTGPTNLPNQSTGPAQTASSSCGSTIDTKNPPSPSNDLLRIGGGFGGFLGG